jgi:CTP:molybdopterin cytidylyltransferase MocA
MTKPTLLVLAAGMGSRYGGLKQIEPVGPTGETILDYSIYDALRAGFGKVVFVIRRDIQAAFQKCAWWRVSGISLMRGPIRKICGQKQKNHCNELAT